MATKTKMTPIGRLIIFLLILIPAAYAGAAYINGEDPVANFKNMIGTETTAVSSTQQSATASESSSKSNNELDRLRAENAELRSRVKQLETTIKNLEEAASSNRQNWGTSSDN